MLRISKPILSFPMKPVLLFTFFIFPILPVLILVGNSSAQKRIDNAKDAEVYVSSIISRKRGKTIDRYMKIEDDEYNLRLESKREYEFVRYNTQLEIVESRTEKTSINERIEKNEKRYGKGQRMFFRFGDRDYLLMGVKDGDHNIFTIAELDENDNLVSEPRQLARIEGIGHYRKVRSAYLDYEFSEDGSKLLIWFRLRVKTDQNGDNYTRYRFMVFDSDLKKLWTEDVDFLNTGGAVNYRGNGWLLNDGSVYCFATLNRGRDHASEGRLAMRLYHIDGVELQVTTQNCGSAKNSWKVNLIDNEMWLISTYGDASLFTGKLSEGFVFLKWSGIDADEVRMLLAPFGLDHIIKNQPKEDIVKWQKSVSENKPAYVPNLNLHRALKQEDGSFLIFGQEQSSRETKNGGTIYYNQDLHIFNLSENGKIRWSNIVTINQRTWEGSTGAGYRYKILDDMVYVIFNDNYDNLKEGWNSSQPVARFMTNDNPVTLVSLDLKEPEVKLQRQLLWDSKSVGGLFSPRKYYSHNESDFALVYIEGDNLKQSLVRIDFK